MKAAFRLDTKKKPDNTSTARESNNWWSHKLQKVVPQLGIMGQVKFVGEKGTCDRLRQGAEGEGISTSRTLSLGLVYDCLLNKIILGKQQYYLNI